MKKTMVAQVILVLLFAVPAGGFPDEPWDKAPERWSLAEIYHVLTDSPWSPARTAVELSLEQRRTDPLTKQPVKLPEGVLNGPPAPVVGVGLARRPQLGVPVLWWSSKIVRLAQQRLRQLREPTAKREPLRAEDLPDHVLVVEGAEALRILRDAVENLRETVFLELPGGASLDVVGIRFVEGEKAGEDFVEFHFPRQVEGRLIISPDAEKVVFHCTATARTARPGRPNALSIRAVFDPRKMRVRGQPDL